MYMCIPYIHVSHRCQLRGALPLVASQLHAVLCCLVLCCIASQFICVEWYMPPPIPPPPLLLLPLFSFSLLGHARRRNSKRRPHVLSRIINLHILAQQLLLARLVGEVSAHEVAVFLGLEQGDQVDARPHLFAGELTENRQTG
ncbi:hypothetical protein F5Y00DRAFT_246443 [Daldinia vernicosa]|uniref:uncharacterized protein n=1 Tax=Daldinia vernicosa TaxID=114800 RepID=UPI002008D06C|nr:uncharacterized protein F5Y00DRAFT_246443 [Daldinia vernicosa]KAI0845379.1 hypothetical protein F5Y00DRAFT_246443 [Daldinia vernicosa]